MKRYPMKRGKDRKVFRATSKSHPSNSVKFVMRGGIRK